MALPNQTWLNLPEWALPVAQSNGSLHINTARNRLWYVGGGDVSANRPEVYTTRINGDGGLAGWRTAGVLPKGMAFHGAVMTDDNWLFLLNGLTNSPTNALYAVRVGPEGEFDTPVTNLGSLDIALSEPVVVQHDKWLYVLGGNDGAVI